MKKFGFICHPLDFQHLAEVDAGIVNKSPRLVKQVMAQLPPHHVRTFEITSPTGAKALGEMICVWLLPDQFTSLDRRLVQAKLLEAFEIAQDLQCELVGLGAYTKIAPIHCPEIYERFPFAITTGNTYTAALSVRTLERLIHQRNWLRDEIEMTVIGATGAIGNAVLRAMAPQVAKMHLVGRNLASLENAAREISGYGCKVETFVDAKFASRESNLVFLATSEPGLLIQATDLALHTGVVDISKPVNIVPDPSRPDITIVDCAMVATPTRQILCKQVKCFPDVQGLSSPEVFACFAESMILALENRLESYSQGKMLKIEKFDEILAMAQKHGFTCQSAEALAKVDRLEVGLWNRELNVELPGTSTNFRRRFGIAS